jgi:hypothetical protein
MGRRERIKTPMAFRDVLLDMARSAQLQCMTHVNR